MFMPTPLPDPTSFTVMEVSGQMTTFRVDQICSVSQGIASVVYLTNGQKLHVNEATARNIIAKLAWPDEYIA